MTRYLSILLVFFMLSPMFTPLAGAMDSCGPECAVGEHHECRHGKTCPMHRKKAPDQAQAGHGGHYEDHAAHHAGHDEGVKTDKSLICTVSDSTDEAAPEKERDCFIMSGCDHEKDPVSTVAGSDYLVSKIHFEPSDDTGFIKSSSHNPYRGPAPRLLERPPSA